MEYEHRTLVRIVYRRANVALHQSCAFLKLAALAFHEFARR